MISLLKYYSFCLSYSKIFRNGSVNDNNFGVLNRQVIPWLILWRHIDGLVQDCGNSIADALNLPQSWAKP